MLVLIHKNHYNIPTCYNQLTGRQLVNVLQVLNSQVQLLPAKIKLFKILTGISWFKLWWAGPVELEDKLYLTDFLMQDNTLTKNLLPHYMGVYGPAGDFNNLQVQEFIFTEEYYRQYKEAESLQHLHMLIAILYRPTKAGYNQRLNADGDVREPYNDNLTALYARKIACWPMAVKQAILFWYEGCRQALVNNNPDVFGGAGGVEAQYGLWSVMRGVAEKGIHGDMSHVETMYVKVFMMELNELIAEARRIEEAYKKAGK